MVECALAFEGIFGTMKILCKQKINTTTAAMKELQMLLECIGSSEFKWITDKIKSLPEKAQRRKQKVSYLPVAFPSLKGDICRTMQRYGGDIRTVTLKGKNGRTNVWDFAIFDYDLFRRHLEENHFDLVRCLPIDRHENSLVE